MSDLIKALDTASLLLDQLGAMDLEVVGEEYSSALPRSPNRRRRAVGANVAVKTAEIRVNGKISGGKPGNALDGYPLAHDNAHWA